MITEKLAQHLVPGGTLVVVDWARTEVANDVPQDYRKIVSNGGGEFLTERHYWHWNLTLGDVQVLWNPKCEPSLKKLI